MFRGTVFLYKTEDKDTKTINLLVLELSLRNYDFKWKLFGINKGNINFDSPIEEGTGVRNKNVNTLYEGNDKFASLTFSKPLDLVAKGSFGQFERFTELHYIQAQFLGKALFENSKIIPVSFVNVCIA